MAISWDGNSWHYVHKQLRCELTLEFVSLRVDLWWCRHGWWQRNEVPWVDRSGLAASADQWLHWWVLNIQNVWDQSVKPQWHQLQRSCISCWWSHQAQAAAAVCLILPVPEPPLMSNCVKPSFVLYLHFGEMCFGSVLFVLLTLELMSLINSFRGDCSDQFSGNMECKFCADFK